MRTKFNISKKFMIISISIIIFSFIIGLILPGIISYKSGVFYSHDIINKLPVKAKENYVLYEKRKEEVKNKLQVIDKKLIDDADLQPEKLIAMYNHYTLELSQLKPPIKLLGFYLNPLMFFWPIFYVCLLIIVLFLAPIRKNYIFSWHGIITISKILLILFIIYRSPNYLRNFEPEKSERVIYSYSNIDVNTTSFYYQEFQATVAAILLSIIVFQWLSFLFERRKQFNKNKQLGFKRIFSLSTKLSKTFIRWQATSFLILPIFVWYSTWYWYLVIINNDNRYILSAIVIHIILISIWLIVTLQLLLTLYYWQKWKTNSINKLIVDSSINLNKKQFLIKELKDLQPIAFWKIIGSFLAGVISIIVPFLNLLK